MSEGTGTFTYKHGVARTAFPSDIFIEFDRMVEKSKEITAEVYVGSLASDGDGRIHRARLNLTSTQARGTLAKHLAARTTAEGHDWSTMLEEACWATVDAFRQGQPAFFISDAKEPVGAGSVLNGLVLPGRHVTIAFADPASGKSYLALAIALTLQTGREIIPGLRAKARMNVAYLDWEWDAWEHRKRVVALIGNEKINLLYVPCHGVPLIEQVDRLRRLFKQYEIEYAIIDSIGYATDGPPEEAQSALSFFAAFQRLEIGALATAHINRAGDTKQPYGSAFWAAGPRSTWYVKKVQEVAGKSLTIGLYNRKHTAGPLADPVGLIFDFGEDRVGIQRTDLRDIPELAEGVATVDRVVYAIQQNGPMTYDELQAELDTSKDTIVHAVGRRAKKGQTFTFLPRSGTNPQKIALLAHPDDSHMTRHGVSSEVSSSPDMTCHPASYDTSSPSRTRAQNLDRHVMSSVMRDSDRDKRDVLVEGGVSSASTSKAKGVGALDEELEENGFNYLTEADAP